MLLPFVITASAGSPGTRLHVKSSKLPVKEKILKLLKLIKQLEHELLKAYPEIRRDRMILQSDRIRSPRPNYRQLIEDQLAKSPALGDLEEESMPEYSSVWKSSERSGSILESQEMDTEGLFEEGFAEPLPPGQYNVPDGDFAGIANDLSAIDEESSPELVTTDSRKGLRVSFFTSASDIGRESFPELSKSAIDQSESLEGISEIIDESSPELASSGPIEISETLGSDIQEESFPDISSSGAAGHYSSVDLFKTSASDILKESFPDMSSSVESSSKGFGDLSILGSQEMDTGDLFEGGIMEPEFQEDYQISGNLSEIDEESSPEFYSAASQRISQEISDSQQLQDVSMPQYSSFERSFSKSKGSKREESLFKSSLSEIFKESFPDFPDSSTDDSSRYSGDLGILESQEMDTGDLFQVSSFDIFSDYDKVHGTSIEELSAIDSESSPELSSGFTEDSLQIFDESFPDISSSLERSGFRRLASTGRSFLDKIEEESEIGRESFPEVSASVTDPSTDGSILQSHEMHTQDLFEDIMSPGQYQRKDLFGIEDELSAIDEESSPELYSSQIQEESFPEVSSSFDRSKERSSGRSRSRRDLLREVLTPGRRGDSRRSRPDSTSGRKSLPKSSRIRMNFRMEESSPNTTMRYALEIIDLQSKELQRTRTYFKEFMSKIENVMSTLRFSHERDLPKESIRRIFETLEGEMESFVGARKELPT
ncbi:uncharacterized protein LOC129798460 [Phlebotomus papatasi]|uniref:uncharacterized protein LOC129798460 n=1 Tax=Phlebotomus papatasi TaxID=29031 RepID=UPI002484409C|nr:uncharacterized protein LOC129798460 [Phlebotomus papatasi]